MSNAKEVVDAKIAGKKVVIFSKTHCPHCVRVKAVLKEYNLSPDDMEIMELDRSRDTEAIQDYLKKLTGARTVPRVFVGGKSVGGCDDTVAAHKNGKLRKQIEAC